MPLKGIFCKYKGSAAQAAGMSAESDFHHSKFFAMRKTLLIPLFFAAFIATDFAQIPVTPTVAVLPSTAVLASFEHHYPAVSVSSWKLEKGKYEANFRAKNRNMACLLDSTGRLLETETQITFAELPRPVQKALNEAQVLKVERILTVQGSTFYEAETARGDLHFRPNGKLFHPKKNTPGEIAGGS